MLCSKFVGVIGGTKEEYGEVDGEVLYLTTFHIREVEYPLVGYDTSFMQIEKGKAEVIGYVKSEKKFGRLFTYILALSASPCEEDVEETSYIEVEGYITKRPMVVNVTIGLEVQPFIISYKDPVASRVMLHAVAKGALARQVARISEGSKIKIGGILLSKRRTLELVTKKVINKGGG